MRIIIYELMLQKNRNITKNAMTLVLYNCVYMQAMFACISLHVII